MRKTISRHIMSSESPIHASSGQDSIQQVYVRGDPLYDENPLIRHIAPIPIEPKLVDEDVANLPVPPNDEERALPLIQRLQRTGRIPRLHIPLGHDHEIAQTIDELILEGYVDRAPDARFWAQHDQQIKSFLEAFRRTQHFAEADRATGLLGIPGIGKSRALMKRLKKIRQVIIHKNTDDPCLPYKQVVWIKIDCPHNRSPGSIAKKIIRAIGLAVEEDYSRTFGGGNNDDDIVAAAVLVRIHFVGLIIIDDVQNAVSRAKIPKTDIIDVLVELSNELGIPLLLVGTPKAVTLLGKQMRSGRKLLGPTWDRYGPDDQDLRTLLETLWQYQWNKTFTLLTDPLRKKLYDLTQGVPAFVVRLFHFAQRRAILLGGDELLTDTLFEDTFALNFTVVQPIVRALASGDNSLIERFDDLPKEFSLEEMLAREAEFTRRKESLALQHDIHRARLSASRSARKRIRLEAALSMPSREGSGSILLEATVQDALARGVDPVEALVAAGLLGKNALSSRNVSKF